MQVIFYHSTIIKIATRKTPTRRGKTLKALKVYRGYSKKMQRRDKSAPLQNTGIPEAETDYKQQKKRYRENRYLLQIFCEIISSRTEERDVPS